MENPGLQGLKCTVNNAVAARELVTAVKPLLERKDLPGLMALLKSRWTPQQITSFLCCDHGDVRKVAALALGLVGGNCCLGQLARQLQDPDPMVNQMTEHALWQIWFRGGTAEANHHLCRGAKAIERSDYPHAVSHFNKALVLCPSFAEAFNQRALAEYLLEQYDASIIDCQRAVELMPIHFGAWTGMGHCHAHQGRLPQAISCYQKALSINPHMCQIRQAVEEIKCQISADV
jgi:hypothetical protein